MLCKVEMGASERCLELFLVEEAGLFFLEAPFLGVDNALRSRYYSCYWLRLSAVLSTARLVELTFLNELGPDLFWIASLTTWVS